MPVWEGCPIEVISTAQYMEGTKVCTWQGCHHSGKGGTALRGPVAEGCPRMEKCINKWVPIFLLAGLSHRK